MTNIPFKFSELLLDIGGKSFDNGLYSIHTFEDSLKWTNILSKYYTLIAGSIISFAHDWMGRQYCVPINSNECVLMYDHATFEQFTVEVNLFEFHNDFLCNSKTNSLGSDYFVEALKYLSITSLEYDNCIGFKTPLFLNGAADPSNYLIMNTEAYWDFEFQLFSQISKLPDGTQIGTVGINPF